MTPTLVRSITEALRRIKRGEAIRAEGVGGVLIVKREIVKRETVFGLWQCTYHRCGKCEACGLLNCITDIHDWLRAFFPRLLGRDPRGDTSRYRGGRMSREDRRRLSAPPTRTRCRRK